MPAVTVGCDSIQIMELLHAKLEEKGFYCADDEREDWYFGESTQNAVMSFQASNGLTENGSVTAKEWEVLLEGETDFVWEDVQKGDVAPFRPFFVCPACGMPHDDSHKRKMLALGLWVPTRPVNGKSPKATQPGNGHPVKRPAADATSSTTDGSRSLRSCRSECVSAKRPKRSSFRGSTPA